MVNLSWPAHLQTTTPRQMEDLQLAPLHESDDGKEMNNAAFVPMSSIRNEEYHEKSSCEAEQSHSDVSLETVDRRAPKNSKNYQWTTEGDVTVQGLTPAPHGGE
ncbi:hypothetical protein TNCV_2863271 [Trichonephila clavipes]|nr:hypothetical protein TNCV_2863271 [Trichonephila clavipes]